jgi:hypothetical protein
MSKPSSRSEKYGARNHRRHEPEAIGMMRARQNSGEEIGTGPPPEFVEHSLRGKVAKP